MDNPRKCVIYFEAHLSLDEIEQRIAAIRLIEGVKSVATDQTSVKVPPDHDEMVYEATPDRGLERHAIDRALIWGVKKGVITTAQLQGMEAEELVSLAYKMLERMPEEEKKQLGSEISHLMK